MRRPLNLAIPVYSSSLALAFLCLLMRPAVAGGVFQADDSDPYPHEPVPVSTAVSGGMAATPMDESSLRLRNGLIIATSAALVAVYGSRKWWHSDFGGGFDSTNEHWFGSDTQFGGADKLGHLYSNYASVRLLTPLFESAGNTRQASVSLATWSTLGIFTGIEIADGFSRTWQFSPQDEIANALGTLLGVVLETNPGLDGIFDFRVDYRRSPRASKFDPFSDYSALKFLFVVKADGFAPMRENTVLRYLEATVGYGTRGYETGGVRSRDVYVGLSLNLARLLADGAYGGRMHTTAFQRGTDRLFELVQFPTIIYEKRSMN